MISNYIDNTEYKVESDQDRTLLYKLNGNDLIYTSIRISPYNEVNINDASRTYNTVVLLQDDILKSYSEIEKLNNLHTGKLLNSKTTYIDSNYIDISDLEPENNITPYVKYSDTNLFKKLISEVNYKFKKLVLEIDSKARWTDIIYNYKGLVDNLILLVPEFRLYTLTGILPYRNFTEILIPAQIWESFKLTVVVIEDEINAEYTSSKDTNEIKAADSNYINENEEDFNIDDIEEIEINPDNDYALQLVSKIYEDENSNSEYPEENSNNSASWFNDNEEVQSKNDTEEQESEENQIMDLTKYIFKEYKVKFDDDDYSTLVESVNVVTKKEELPWVSIVNQFVSKMPNIYRLDFDETSNPVSINTVSEANPNLGKMIFVKNYKNNDILMLFDFIYSIDRYMSKIKEINLGGKYETR